MEQSRGFFEFFRIVNAENSWILEIVLGVVGLAVLNLILVRLIKYYRKKTETTHGWMSKLEHIFISPFQVVLLIIGLFYIVDTLAFHLNFPLFKLYSVPLRNAILVICFTWLAVRWKKEVQRTLLTKPHPKRKLLDPASIDFMGKILSILIFFISFLLILGILGIDIMPLVAFGGIGAAAIGFAAKDMIANFFGGLMIQLTRPVTRGDFIEIPEKGISGTVENIGWYVTTLRELSKTPVYLPNSFFSSSLIKNFSRITHRRFEEVFQMRYDDFSQLEQFMKEVKSYLSQHPQVDKGTPLSVFFQNFASHSLEVYVRCYLLETDYELFMLIRQEILIKIKEFMDSFHLQTPYPTSTIIVQQERR